MRPAVVLALTLAACASHDWDDTWTKPDGHGAPFMHVLVIGAGRNTEWRAAVEDALIEPIRARSHGAIASHTFIPEFTRQDDRRWLPRTLSGRAIDGILTIRRVRPGAPMRETLGPAVFDKVPEDAAALEISLWEARSWGRIWTGRTTATLTPDKLAEAIMAALTEAELL